MIKSIRHKGLAKLFESGVNRPGNRGGSNS